MSPRASDVAAPLSVAPAVARVLLLGVPCLAVGSFLRRAAAMLGAPRLALRSSVCATRVFGCAASGDAAGWVPTKVSGCIPKFQDRDVFQISGVDEPFLKVGAIFFSWLLTTL